jgi:hypothetical protein
MKVTLYIREHGTRRCRKAKPGRNYPMGTIYVLRYGSTWETLPPNLDSTEATVARLNKEIVLFTGKEAAKPKPKPKNDVLTLDILIDIYLTTGRAAEKNWRKHTLQVLHAGTETVPPIMHKDLPARNRRRRPAAVQGLPADPENIHGQED